MHTNLMMFLSFLCTIACFALTACKSNSDVEDQSHAVKQNNLIDNDSDQNNGSNKLLSNYVKKPLDSAKGAQKQSDEHNRALHDALDDSAAE